MKRLDQVEKKLLESCPGCHGLPLVVTDDRSDWQIPEDSLPPGLREHEPGNGNRGRCSICGQRREVLTLIVEDSPVWPPLGMEEIEDERPKT